jgi:hypothetical protein
MVPTRLPSRWGDREAFMPCYPPTPHPTSGKTQSACTPRNKNGMTWLDSGRSFRDYWTVRWHGYRYCAASYLPRSMNDRMRTRFSPSCMEAQADQGCATRLAELLLACPPRSSAKELRKCLDSQGYMMLCDRNTSHRKL